MLYKIKNKILLILLCSCLLINQSCKKGWLDVNYDPNQLGDANVTPDLMLPILLAELPSESAPLQRWMGYWCVPPEVPPGIAEQTYNITPTTKSFNVGIRLGEMKQDFKIFENKSRQTNQIFYLGIAKAIGALQWSKAVDKYNKLPYTEAFRSDIRKPGYDDGQTIYEDLVKQLDTAITLIKGADIDDNVNIEQTDIMFHGSKSKWVKFINTLKLRLLIHQANKAGRGPYIQAEIAKILAEGSGFLNSMEDASVNPGYTEIKPNPYYFTYQYLRQDWIGFDRQTFHFTYELSAANVFALNLYKASDDPRIAFFYSPIRQSVPPGSPEPFSQSAPDNFRGNKFGLAVDTRTYFFQGESYTSLLGGITVHGPVTPSSSGLLKGYDMSGWVITSVESLFLQAEATQRGWLAGSAEAAYKKAVKESFRWLNVGGNSNIPALSDVVFEAWYNQQVTNGNPEVSWATAPDKYKLVMLQKYLALNGIDAFETWTDYRRNGQFPAVPVSADPDNASTVMPIRLPYALTEYEQNTENVNAVGPINIFTGKIWWMP